MKITEIIDKNKQFLDALNAVKSLDEKEVLTKQLYLFTKEMLDHHKNNPAIKRIIFDNYIDIWKNASCLLEIKNLDHADGYENKKFGDLQHIYAPTTIMTFGFDLSGVDFAHFNESDMIFICVNFANANFSAASFVYSHFEECNLQQVKTDKTNFNQCRFMHCNLTDARLDTVRLSEAYFKDSILVGTELSKHRYRDHRTVNCAEHIDDRNYANLLQQWQAKNGKAIVELNTQALSSPDNKLADAEGGYVTNRLTR